MKQTTEQKQAMIEAFQAFDKATTNLTTHWLGFPSDGESFTKDFPLAGYESFCDFAAKVRKWAATSINDLSRTTPLSFQEFRETREVVSVPDFIEQYGVDELNGEDADNIAFIFRYGGDNYHIEVLMDGRFSMVISNQDWNDLDIQHLEFELYKLYLLHVENDNNIREAAEVMKNDSTRTLR